MFWCVYFHNHNNNNNNNNNPAPTGITADPNTVFLSSIINNGILLKWFVYDEDLSVEVIGLPRRNMGMGATKTNIKYNRIMITTT